MSNPIWAYNDHCTVMNEIELGFRMASDESSSLLHRFVKAVPGTVYDISHNYWRRG